MSPHPTGDDLAEGGEEVTRNSLPPSKPSGLGHLPQGGRRETDK